MRLILALLFLSSIPLFSNLYSAEQTVPGYFAYPKPSSDDNTGGPNYGTVSLSQVGDKAASVIQVPKTGTVVGIDFRYGSLGTDCTFDVRLETVDTTTGDPSGTLYDTNTSTTVLLPSTGDDEVHRFTLDASTTVTRGEYVAIVSSRSAGSGTNCQMNFYPDEIFHNAYFLADTTGGGYVKQTSRMGAGALVYEGEEYNYTIGLNPGETGGEESWNTSSNPDHRGLKFSIPFPARLSGIWAWHEPDGDLAIKLYDSDGETLLASASVDPDIDADITAEDFFYYMLDTNVSLSKDVDYRLVINPLSGTNVSLSYIQTPSTSAMLGLESGLDFVYTEQHSPIAGGSWTDDTTKRPFLGLLLDGFSDTGSIQNINGYAIFPPPVLDDGATAVSFSHKVLDAVGEYTAHIYQIPKDGTIVGVGYRQGNVTDGNTVEFKLETVDTSNGFPSGTLFDTNVSSAIITVATADNIWQEATFQASTTVVKGQYVAIVASMTVRTAGSVQISQFQDDDPDSFYIMDNVSGSPSKTTTIAPLMSLIYSGNDYESVPGVWPIEEVGRNIFNSSDNPDHRGLKFQLPFDFSLAGFWCWCEFEDGTQTTVKLFDSDGEIVLSTFTVDGDLSNENNIDPNFYYIFDASYELSANTDYRIVFAPDGTDIEVNKILYDESVEALWGGSNFVYTEQDSPITAGGWTDTAGERTLVGLLIDGFADGVAAGAQRRIWMAQ